MAEKRFALIIATDHYEDKDLCQLVSPAHDVEALAHVLRDPTIGSFDVQTLLNKPSYEVEKEIEEFFTERKRDDILLLYFSGHGIKDEDGLLYFCTTNTKHKLLRSTAVEANFVNNVMHRSRSQMQVLLLDCCYSGAFARGMSPKADKAINTKERFTGKGLVVLTASDAMQYSFEGGMAEPSVFTSSLVQGLKTGAADSDGDGDITPHELYDYVYTTVIDKKPEQIPRMWNFGVEGKIVLARNPNPVVKPVALSKELLEVMNNPSPVARIGAVHELRDLLYGENKGLTLSALNSLKIMKNDDSRRVSVAATKILDEYEKTQSEKKMGSEAQQVIIDTNEGIPHNIEVTEEKPVSVDEAHIEPEEQISTGQEKEVEPPPEPPIKKEVTPPKKGGAFVWFKPQPPIKKEVTPPIVPSKKRISIWLLPAILVSVISGLVVFNILLSPKFVKIISEWAVICMLKEKGLFDEHKNNNASGFANDFVLQHDGKVVYDRASGLMWQQSGSAKGMEYGKAKVYIDRLNHDQFAGYSNWRLPTLEEAMSLMEPTKMNGNLYKLYIDPLFDSNQWLIWTSDGFDYSSPWVVSFSGGYCYVADAYNVASSYNDVSVRAVRY